MRSPETGGLPAATKKAVLVHWLRPLRDHPNRHWATIVLVDCTNPRGYVICQIEQYSRPGTEHSPVLYADGSFKMNQGSTYMVK
ncbi:hypothetical protein [Actinoallomurus soli]|uniref:hypothetical protein n=1 Tax=Actinoallomurus soli TaxID=2952535 RepID=UPI00209312F3|nr:hypothetical protein [Actinoallomurus soli]MCO5967315.1 hypothetical protein [Actinoallomurus soli]